MTRHIHLRAYPEALASGMVTVITASLDYWPETGFDKKRLILATQERPGLRKLS